MARKRYIIVDPDGDPVYNDNSQNCFFPSIKAAWRGVKEYLEEPDSEDFEGHTFTVGDESGLSEKDFRLFVEVH